MKNSFAILASLFVLSACGGGGSDSSPTFSEWIIPSEPLVVKLCYSDKPTIGKLLTVRDCSTGLLRYIPGDTAQIDFSKPTYMDRTSIDYDLYDANGRKFGGGGGEVGLPRPVWNVNGFTGTSTGNFQLEISHLTKYRYCVIRITSPNRIGGTEEVKSHCIVGEIVGSN